MYPILFAVLSSFAFGMVAGVVASWTITALRERSPEPHGGMPGENSAESGADADRAQVTDIATRRRAA
ncbi:MAG: hypothetical protein H0U53_06820 [Actinobacteria bacterium]|nr:hypothetical protein [Actinomycetota bacterium]